MSNKKMARSGLVWLIVSSILGAGVFALPHELAQAGGAGAALSACLISMLGVFCLANAYQSIYAQKGCEGYDGVLETLKSSYGIFFTSLSSWGYWCSAWVGNLAYLGIIAKSYRTCLESLNIHTALEWHEVCFASLVLWISYTLLIRGADRLAFVNKAIGVLKLLLMGLVVLLLIKGFSLSQLWANWTAWISDVFYAGAATGQPQTLSFYAQVLRALLVTAWLFIGFEGAILIGHRAKQKSDVTSAVKRGLSIVCVVYLTLTLLIYGIQDREALAGLSTPSMAGVAELVIGKNIGTLIAVAVGLFSIGAFLAWSLFASEIPFICALQRLMPERFAKENAQSAPSNSLRLTTIVTQIGLLIAWYQNLDYSALSSCATLMILPSYWMIASLQYYREIVSSASHQGSVLQEPQGVIDWVRRGWFFVLRWTNVLGPACAILYTLFLAYAGGLAVWLHALLLFVVGLLVAVPAWLAEQRIGAAPMKRLKPSGD